MSAEPEHPSPFLNLQPGDIEGVCSSEQARDCTAVGIIGAGGVTAPRGEEACEPSGCG